MNTSKNRFWFAILLLLTVAAGCGVPQAKQADPELGFEVQMQVNSGQQFHASFGVENRGPTAFAGDKAFEGKMELRYADGAQTGELRASAKIVELARLDPGETAWPVAWRAQLDPGAYTLTWGAADYGFTSVEFQIVERDGRLYLDV
jgi:hypothetical protein